MEALAAAPIPPRRPGAPPPPRYKTAVVMWVSAYPTITLLLWLLWPLAAGWPLPLRTLLLSVLMVPLMTWLVVPGVTTCLAGWLRGAPASAEGKGMERA